METCLVCGLVLQDQQDNFARKINHKTSSTENVLDKQLSNIFVLGKLLELPDKSLEKCFSLSGGENPSSWFAICGGDCQKIVKNAQGAYEEMCRARQKLMECQNKFRDMIMVSRASFRNSAFQPKDYRDEILKMVWETLQIEKKPEAFNYTADFMAGDQMASQLLQIRLRLASQTVIPTQLPVKAEVEADPLFVDDHGTDIDVGPITLSIVEVKPDVGETRTTAKATASNRQSKCPQCEFWGTPMQVQRHATRLHGLPVTQPMTKCSQCDFQGKRKSVRQHEDRAHPIPGSNYPCDKCDKTFVTKSCLYNHKWHCHKDKPKVKCPHCDYTTDQGNAHVKRHILARHERPHMFPCEICKRKFNILKNLRYHQKTCHNKCSVESCGKICESQESLRDHQIKDHGMEIDVWKCPECGLLCRHKSALRDHKLINHRKGNEKVYKCDECDKVCFTQKILSDHIYNVHTPKDKKGKKSNKKRGSESVSILGI